MFKIGTLVQLNNPFHPSNGLGAIGIIVDTGVHHDGERKYQILFFNGYKSWWEEDRVEVLCK
tara:strand:+ start:762 stop:947 length:186 start_codon:yes stop_codon:yes gene_type:complete